MLAVWINVLTVAVGVPGSLVGLRGRPTLEKCAAEVSVLVRELAGEVAVVGLDDPVLDAVRAMWRRKVPGLVVVDGRGRLVAVLSVTEVLRLVVSPYVGERLALARVIDEEHADEFLSECTGRSMRDCLPRGHRRSAVVMPDATVLEAAASMAGTGCPIVAVVDDDGGVLGAVSWGALLDGLLAA
ncbi:CBS domain-containing protein [Actinomadura sp. BRA 177]|nr:CBS domain-containing protein [Actinomadura sp. BRA 177]